MYYKRVDDDMVFDIFAKKYYAKPKNNHVLDKLTVFDIQTLKDIRIKNTLDIIITVTTECDLKCEYCFENHLKRKHMNMETCETIIDEIKEYVKLN